MILVCPSCDTRYFADDTAIGKDGRRVRCASCGHSWYVKAAEEAGAAEPAPVQEATGLTREQVERLRQTAAANSAARAGPHAEFRAREHSRRQRQRSFAASVAWASGFAVFAASAAALVVFREDVVATWPRTASFYALAGLEVNRFGLLLVDESARRSFDGTTPVLTISGAVVNEGAEQRPAPHIRISLRDEEGDEIHAWTDAIGVDVVAPGERVAFSSRIVAPPVETFQLVVSFTDPPALSPETDTTAVEQTAEAPASRLAADRLAADPPGLADEYEDPPWTGGDGAPDDALPDPLSADE